MTTRKPRSKHPLPPDHHLYRPKTYIAPINATPASSCPIPHASSTILLRYEREHNRPTYRVRIAYNRHTSRSEDEEEEDEEVEEVDLSAILNYVSPLELERFENAEFKREREAAAVAERERLREEEEKR
ncbi:hypothetical protein K432DRAFT_446030, partial [Lepidopterella palustris CBS 459.81]